MAFGPSTISLEEPEASENVGALRIGSGGPGLSTSANPRPFMRWLTRSSSPFTKATTPTGKKIRQRWDCFY